jgi:hypothetical protein
MRGLVLRRAGSVILGGLLLGAPLGATVGSAGASAQTTTTTTPCTSASYALNIAVTGGDSASSWSLTVNGQIDFTNDAATANLTLPSSFPFAPLAGANLQVVLVGGTVYAAVPPALQSYVGGASWVSIALPSTLNDQLNSLLGRVATWCGSGQSVVGALGAAPRHHHKHGSTSLGSSSIGGVPVTGTHVTKPSNTVTNALGLPSAWTGTGKGKGHHHRHGAGAAGSVNVWDDSEGQLTELSVETPQFTLTLTFSNVNQPVSITAPTGATPLPPSILSFLAGGSFGGGGSWGGGSSGEGSPGESD